jgi:hypothetical protein
MTLTRLFPGDEEASSRARSGRRGGGDAWRRGFEPVATGREETRKRVERTSPSSGRAGRVREWRARRGGRAWGVCFLSSRSVYDSRNAPICEKDYRVLLCVTECSYSFIFRFFPTGSNPRVETGRTRVRSTHRRTASCFRFYRRSQLANSPSGPRDPSPDQ